MQESRHTSVVISAGAVIMLIQAFIALAVYWLLPDWQTRGQFGDVFGVVNALFSGLAFAGLIYAILLQRQDLALQRTELELTRQELRRSAGAQEQSEIALRAQASAAAQSTRLAAINFLLDHYKDELREMQGQAFTGNDPRLARLQDLKAREETLLQMLDSMFKEVTEQGESRDTTQDR
jgi:hypothetical protein